MAKLRDAPFGFHDLLSATANSSVAFRVDGGDVRYACHWCDETFTQDSDGFRSMRAHEMQHGRATTCDVSELDGLRLRIVAVGAPSLFGGDAKPEIWGVDDANGIVYHLSNAYQDRTVWKWKLGAGSGGHGDSSVAMLCAAACP